MKLRLRKSQWYHLVYIIFLNSLANADQSYPLHEGIKDLLFTNFREIDLDRDGITDVTRSYDKQGNLKELISQNPKIHSLRKWQRLSDREVTSEYTGKTLTRQETYFPISHRVEKIWSSSTKTPMNQRVIIEADSEHVWEKKFQKNSHQSWIFLEKKVYEPVSNARVEKNINEHFRCLEEKNSSSSIELPTCESQLAGLLQGSLKSTVTDFTKFSQVKCINNSPNGDQLWLPNSFRIDITSCSEKRAQQQLETALDGVVNHQLSCLSRANPNVAKKLALLIAERRPKMVCFGGKNGRKAIEKRCQQFAGKSDSRFPNCTEDYVFSVKRGMRALYNDTSPNELILAAADPMLPPTHDNSTLTIESIAFHELLHAAGYPHGSEHNYGVLDDPVYGCMALCSRDPKWAKHATYEACSDCLHLDGQTVNPSTIELQCGRYMKREPLNQISGIMAVKRISESCLDKSNADVAFASCNVLEGKWFQKEFCNSKEKCTPQTLTLNAYEKLKKIKAQPGFSSEKSPYDLEVLTKELEKNSVARSKN